MEVKRVVIYSVTVVMILFTGYMMSDYFVDRSQTVIEAQKYGAPSSDQVWTVQDYEMFYRYLSVMPKDIDYPVLSSDKSGRLFKNFIDSLDDVLYEPLEDKIIFSKIMKLKVVCQNILKLYVDKDIKVQKYSSEIAYLYGVQIQILTEMQKIADRVVGSVPKDSEHYHINMKGLELMKDGAAVQIGVTLDLLSKYDAFKDNAILLLYFKQYVPELLHFFDKERKDTMKKRIVEVSKIVETPSTKQILNDVASTL